MSRICHSLFDWSANPHSIFYQISLILIQEWSLLQFILLILLLRGHTYFIGKECLSSMLVPKT